MKSMAQVGTGTVPIANVPARVAGRLPNADAMGEMS